MTIYKNFKINATFKDAEVNKAWKDGKRRNRYTVTVGNMENGEKCRFTFWDSLHNTENGIETLDDENTLNAFYCFLSDADAGNMDFCDFCGDFGYDDDSIIAHNVWTACKRSAKSWRRVSGMSISESADFMNELQEIAG